MDGVEIIELELVKKQERGSIFQFENRDSSKLILVKRKKGTVSGAHYHTGKSPMKDPETVVFLDGEFELILKNVKTKEESKQTYNRPIMFKLAPFIYHKIVALTDIVLLDMNSIDDDKDDTIKGDSVE